MHSVAQLTRCPHPLSYSVSPVYSMSPANTSIVLPVYSPSVLHLYSSLLQFYLASIVNLVAAQSALSNADIWSSWSRYPPMLWLTPGLCCLFQSLCGEVPSGEIKTGLPGAQWTVSIHTESSYCHTHNHHHTLLDRSIVLVQNTKDITLYSHRIRHWSFP